MAKKIAGILGKWGWAMVVLACWLANVPSARAQSATPPGSEVCRACHENLYLLHDTGKAFCLCAQNMTCTCCHGGNPASFVEAEAHQGMVRSPVHGDTTPCQKCHPDDATARTEKFATLAGVSAFHLTLPAPAVMAPASSEIPATVFLLHWLVPWQWAGLGGVGTALIVVLILGYRCWKADCLMKIQNR